MKQVVVIGAGFGGLALGIRLQLAGMQVHILEQRDKPGGRAYVYQDKGFTFDAGPTVITDPSAIERLFIQADRQLANYCELLPVNPLYRLCWEDGRQFNYVNHPQGLMDQIAKFNVKDVKGYARFLDYSKQVFNEGYLRLGSKPFLQLSDMTKAAPQLIKLKAWKSVYQMVSSFIQDPQLRQAFSFHSLLVGGDPFHTSAIYTLIHALEREWGVWFPKGGTGALINAMTRLFEELGGKLELNAKVVAIDSQLRRVTGVRLADQRYFKADAVASNADVVNTYKNLLEDNALGHRRGNRLTHKRMSNSLFVLYFGLDRLHEQLAHHTICFGARYRELIHEIFNGAKLADDFSLYLHSPCITDPSLAPKGAAAYYVLAPVPHLGNAPLNWELEGPKLRERIFDYLEQRYMPGLRSQLITQRIFTPQDFQQSLGAHLGSAFSLEPRLTQSAWFRPHNRDPDINNLYLVGAGTHPGAGVPGVLASAEATANLMQEDL